MTTKIFLNNIIEIWFKKFILNQNKYKILEKFISKKLSQVTSENIKNFKSYMHWDFTPDIAYVLLDIKTNKKELVIINSKDKKVGIVEIGEMICFNRLSNPLFSFLISHGHSSEISHFLVNDNYRNKLLNYNNKSLILFSFNDNEVNQESIIPFEYRNIVNGQ
jgi:hypothetical protein